MSEFSEELERRQDNAEKLVQKRLNLLTTFCGILLFGSAFWCLWPVFIHGADVLDVLAPTAVAFLWAGILPDLAVSTAQTRSRLGAAASIAWPPIAVIGVFQALSQNEITIGAGLLVISSACIFFSSRDLLAGGYSVARYRAVMGFVGAVAALSVIVPRGVEHLGYSLLVVFLALSIAVRDWIGSDEQRAVRRLFRIRLDSMETKLLHHRSEGSSVDQAAALVLTASQRGHLDPDTGIELLDRAEDSMQRALRLEDDIGEISADARIAVEKAEELAPLAKRPRHTLIQGEREIELGSLEEGEALFRAAKKQALEVSEWWQQAERSITEAKRLLRDQKGVAADTLHSLLEQAEAELDAEKPRKAYEIAIVIPQQLGTSKETASLATELLNQAKNRIDEIDGLDIEEWQSNIKRAEEALESGENDLARGLCESVLREIEAEREAMDHVRRALRQRSKLKKRWQELSDAETWNARLAEVDEAAEKRRWTHAAELLQRLSDALDAGLEDFSEAKELVAFATEEWNRMRNLLEQAGIDLLDEQRRETEQKLGEATQASDSGRIQDCLSALGEFDLACESLRRRL